MEASSTITTFHQACDPYRKRADSALPGCGSGLQSGRLRQSLTLFGERLDGELREQSWADIERAVEEERDGELRAAKRHMADRLAFAREVLGFEPESTLQEAALRSWSRRIIFNCNRQWGKSTIAAIRVLHRAWFWPGSFILLVSRAQAQSGGLLEKVREHLPALGLDGGPGLWRRVKGDGVNRKSIVLPNGSRIVALPGGQKPTRSHSRVAMVVIDEAAMVPDEVHDAVAPTLARLNGELILASTPMGRRGVFFKTWEWGGPQWFRVFGPVDETGQGRGISKKFLAEELERRGQDYFDQEYRCVFLDRESFQYGEDDLRIVFEGELRNWEIR